METEALTLINHHNLFVGNETLSNQPGRTAHKERSAQNRPKAKSTAAVKSAQDDPYRWGATQYDRNDITLAGNKLS